MSRARTITIASALAAGMLVAGCGGGGGGGGGTATSGTGARQPTPRQPITAQIAPFNRAVAAQSCRDFQPLVFSIIRQLPPGSAAGPKECRSTNQALTALRGVRFTRARRYGTVALMEGSNRSGDDEFALWALDGDGRYRFTGVSGRPAQIDTSFRGGRQAAAITQGFIGAVSRGDCKQVGVVLNPSGRLMSGSTSTTAACRRLLAGRLFAPAVRASHDVRAEFMGGTQDLAFSGVATRRGYFTLVLSDVGVGRFRVLDVLPSTPVRIPTATSP